MPEAKLGNPFPAKLHKTLEARASVAADRLIIPMVPTAPTLDAYKMQQFGGPFIMDPARDNRAEVLWYGGQISTEKGNTPENNAAYTNAQKKYDEIRHAREDKADEARVQTFQSILDAAALQSKRTAAALRQQLENEKGK